MRFRGSSTTLRTILIISVYLSVIYNVQATTLRAYSIEELVSSSVCVVLGHPVSVHTFRDENGRIARSVALRVDEYVVGKGPATVTVRLLGGVLGNLAQRVPGEADLTIGEPVLLFLERAVGTRSDSFLVTGMVQGRFWIIEDPKTKERFAARTLGRVNLVADSASTDELMGLDEECTSTFIPLNRFTDLIRRLAVDVE